MKNEKILRHLIWQTGEDLKLAKARFKGYEHPLPDHDTIHRSIYLTGCLRALADAFRHLLQAEYWYERELSDERERA